MSPAEPSEEQRFLQRATALLDGLLEQLDTFDPDELEADATAGVIKITFPSGVCVLNRQSAAHQIWLAEGASAWHFELEPASGTWMDTKGRGSLHQILSAILTQRLGRAVELDP